MHTGNVQTYLMLLVASHRRARGGVRTMSGLPVLSIIVMAPVAAALLIALFGAQPQGAARASRWSPAPSASPARSWVYATYDRTAGGFQFAEKAAVDPVARRLVHRSASTASRSRCCC